jgi:hypothetical protein
VAQLCAEGGGGAMLYTNRALCGQCIKCVGSRAESREIFDEIEALGEVSAKLSTSIRWSPTLARREFLNVK